MVQRCQQIQKVREHISKDSELNVFQGRIPRSALLCNAPVASNRLHSRADRGPRKRSTYQRGGFFAIKAFLTAVNMIFFGQVKKQIPPNFKPLALGKLLPTTFLMSSTARCLHGPHGYEKREKKRLLLT